MVKIIIAIECVDGLVMNLLKVLNKNFNYSYFQVPDIGGIGYAHIHLFGEIFCNEKLQTDEINKLVRFIFEGKYREVVYMPGNFSFILETDKTAYMYYGGTSAFPIYYYENNGELIVSNDFQTLADHLLLKPSPSKIAYLLWGGDCLPYRDIHMLDVDNIIKLDSTGFQHVVYKHNPTEYKCMNMNFEDCCELAKCLVENAVANVAKYKKIGLTLSGGMDSSVLAVCLKKMGADFECFHWMSTKYDIIDETRYVRDLQHMYNLNVSYIDISNSVESNDGYIDRNEHYRVPYNHGSYSWWKKTIDMAREHKIEHLYTGYKGDSLFAGPFSLLTCDDWKCIDKWWLLQYWCNSFSVVNRRQYANISTSDIGRFEFCFARCSDFVNTDMLKQEQSSAATANWNFVYQAESMKYNIFEPAGIKNINPYCDKKLYEFANSLPHFYKSIPIAGQIMYKPVLRKAFEKELPFSVFSRNSKSNFGLLTQKFCENNPSFIKELLLNDSILAKEMIINRDKLIKILNNRESYMQSSYCIIRACYLELWLRKIQGGL